VTDLRLVVGVAFDEEHARSSTVDVVSYDVFVDLTGEGDTFCSRTELGFRCRRDGASVFADLQAVGVRRMILNGEDLPSRDLHGDGRLELPRLDDENTLNVEAEFSYAQEGAGLYRVADSGDGTACVYSKGIEARAPRIFCCFDQPDLRAPMNVAVRAPAGWCCRANFPTGPARPAAREGCGVSRRRHRSYRTCSLCARVRSRERCWPLRATGVSRCR
jgi:aminopeptidase N